VALEEVTVSEDATPPDKKIIPINANDKAAMTFVFKDSTYLYDAVISNLFNVCCWKGTVTPL
jgi:hypothetical protein